MRIRVFNHTGTTSADITEAKTEPDYSPFHDLRNLLLNNWDANTFKPLEIDELFRIATLLVRQNTITALIEENENLWRDDRIRNWLLSQFNSKCWYSEAQETVSSIHVDHYRPKGRISDDVTTATCAGYWWLAFAWSNYKICGQLLNVKKRDVFPFANNLRGNPDDLASLHLESPILIDPRTDDARLISFDVQDEETCAAIPAGNMEAVQIERATRTIDILGLNRLPRLNSKRAARWGECLTEIANWVKHVTHLPRAAPSQPLAIAFRQSGPAKAEMCSSLGR
jgi:hypothetical protein